MNNELDAILAARADHFCKLVVRLRDGLQQAGLAPSPDALVRAAVRLYEIDDDELAYGELDEIGED
jgi:hypothetical protein